MRLFNADSTHWYARDGRAMHMVRTAEGLERSTNLRDARKLGLLPSVTNVLGVIAKPELTAWKMEQVITAALTLPMGANEPLDAFAVRVAADAQARGSDAASFGTRFHEGAAALAGGSMEVDLKAPVGAWLAHYRDWLAENVERVFWAEKTLVCGEHGYAGTADLFIVHRRYGVTLVDIKTQAVRPGAKPRKYDTWSYQLAAYRRALSEKAEPYIRCLNLVVNSLEPQPPVEVLWEEQEMAGATLVFGSACLIWRHEKGYDPRTAAGQVSGEGKEGAVCCESQR
jgi:hypothetical protein